ncbi:HDOD domain-containing protein [Corallincola holothuriorum]|uniref:HDOD domain-containing protein n=1 Tax=Corallincola holothuriorum TaxID=2282215 RepID=A0A368NML8_9GAMM|nr:HDOD domain-containing protein [Corallincola holothuriorum]RCU51095.1 HDOD domain-containing protein [Corallincola holothuriorum]
MAIVTGQSESKVLENVVIPPRPEVLIQVSNELKQTDPDVRVIGDAIAKDVSIAAGVLQIVNSAAYKREKTIESIHQAVMLLGLHRVYAVVRSVALRNMVADSYQLEAFWETASDVAHTCMAVASTLEMHDDLDHAYLLGLFHMAGVPVMMHNFDDYGRVKATADCSGWDVVVDEEIASYGTSHIAIGARLAEKWHLPEVVAEAIYLQYTPEQLFNDEVTPEKVTDMVCVLKVARQVVMRTSETLVTEHDWEKVAEPVAEHLHLTEDSLEQLVESLANR